jgi:hypothetical protein
VKVLSCTSVISKRVAVAVEIDGVARTVGGGALVHADTPPTSSAPQTARVARRHVHDVIA